MFLSNSLIHSRTEKAQNRKHQWSLLSLGDLTQKLVFLLFYIIYVNKKEEMNLSAS